MASVEILSPFTVFRDVDGSPLDAGYVYIGTAGLNPITNPITVYWDSALTIPVMQPIRTIVGMPSRAGTPSVLYAGTDYSIIVKDKRESLIYTSSSSSDVRPQLLNTTDPDKGDALLGVKAPFTGAIARTQDDVNLSNGVTPEDFPGTTIQKLQAAFNYAVDNNLNVNLSRSYDITGMGPIYINKAADALNRRVLYIVGRGGEILKTDAGYVFDATEINVGDINISGVRFVSADGSGCIVWNGDKIIRISSRDNEYFNVDSVISQIDTTLLGGAAPGRFIQSCRFSREHIVGGSGYAFYAYKFIDTTIADNLIEWREHGIGNVENTGGDVNFQQNHNLRITDNLIEGLTGTALNLGNTWCCTIARNYFESNVGYVDLATLLKSNHFGLTFQGNVFFLTVAQKAANFKPVKVGTLFVTSSATLKLNSNAFIGNVSDGELYDKTGTGDIYSIGDYAYQSTGWLSGVLPHTGMITRTTADSHVLRTSGVVKAFVFTSAQALNASETKTVAIALSDSEINAPIIANDAISVYVDQVSTVSVLGVSPVWASASSGTLYVTIQNRTASAIATVTLRVSVTKVYQ